MHKILILTGQSATGKSTLAKRLSKEGFAVLHPTQIFLEHLQSLGYNSTDSFYWAEGKEKGFELRRKLTIERVKMLLPQKDILIEGLYDAKLFSRLTRTFGRSNIFVVGLSASTKFRLTVMKRRRETKEEAEKKDRIKDKHGLQKILGDANLCLKTNKTPHSMSKHILHRYNQHFKR